MSVETTVSIRNIRGLHARAAAKFVEMAQTYKSEVFVTKDGETVNADSIMELLMLAASKGSTIEIRVDGDDAEAASAALTDLVNAGFHEDC